MENTILLDQNSTSLIKNNRKIAITRPGKGDYNLGKAILESPSEQIEVEIESITYKILGDVTKKELLQNGFKTLDDLMNKTLLAHYPDLTIEDDITIIKFKYEE